MYPINIITRLAQNEWNTMNIGSRVLVNIKTSQPASRDDYDYDVVECKQKPYCNLYPNHGGGPGRFRDAFFCFACDGNPHRCKECSFYFYRYVEIDYWIQVGPLLSADPFTRTCTASDQSIKSISCSDTPDSLIITYDDNVKVRGQLLDYYDTDFLQSLDNMLSTYMVSIVVSTVKEYLFGF